MKKNNKSSDVNRFNRYIWLLSVIKNNPGITKKEIDEKWIKNTNLNPDGDKIARKTFYNYLNAIREMFDIDIHCDQAKNTYKIEDEDNSSYLKFKKSMIESFSVKQILDNNPGLNKYFVFEENFTNVEMLEALTDGLHNKLILDIEYKSYDRNEPKKHRIKALCLKNFKQQWYLVASAIQDNRPDFIITYALNRITRITPTNQTFKPLSDFDPDMYFEHSFGIMKMNNEKPAFIEILATKMKANYLRAVPLHKSQEEKGCIGDKVLFSYFMYPSFDLRMELLRHGDEIELRTPESFRNELADLIQRMHSLYKNKDLQ